MGIRHPCTEHAIKSIESPHQCHFDVAASIDDLDNQVMLLYTQVQQKPQIQVQSPIQSDVESVESVHKQKERKVMILVSCLNPRKVSTVL